MCFHLGLLLVFGSIEERYIFIYKAFYPDLHLNLMVSFLAHSPSLH